MIGIFDSGVGGLTVVKEIFRYLPKYRILYFGDTARLPYGTKSPETIRRYTEEAIRFLKRRGAKLIVIACNTSSANADIKRLSRQYRMPIFEVVSPAVEEALRATRNKKIGVIGTSATIRSSVYPRRLARALPGVRVFANAAPLLVPLIEEGWLMGNIVKNVVKYYVEPLKRRGIDTLILACTHYPLLGKLIRQVAGKHTRIVTPAKRLAADIKTYLAAHPRLGTSLKRSRGQNLFFTSDRPHNFDKLARLALGKKVSAKRTTL